MRAIRAKKKFKMNGWIVHMALNSLEHGWKWKLVWRNEMLPLAMVKRTYKFILYQNDTTPNNHLVYTKNNGMLESTDFFLILTTKSLNYLTRWKWSVPKGLISIYLVNGHLMIVIIFRLISCSVCQHLNSDKIWLIRFILYF